MGKCLPLQTNRYNMSILGVLEILTILILMSVSVYLMLDFIGDNSVGAEHTREFEKQTDELKENENDDK